MSKKKNKIKLLDILIVSMIIFNLLFCIYLISVKLIMDSKPKLEYKRCNTIISVPIVNQPSLSKKEITSRIRKEINPVLFIETENHTFDFDDQFCGVRLKYRKGNDEINIPNMYWRVILIDERCEGYEYCFVKTHEYVHAKYFYTDERLTQFTAFKILYESKDEYLYSTSLYYLNHYLSYPPQYDCSYYIVEYLRERGEIL